MARGLLRRLVRSVGSMLGVSVDSLRLVRVVLSIVVPVVGGSLREWSAGRARVVGRWSWRARLRVACAVLGGSRIEESIPYLSGIAVRLRDGRQLMIYKQDSGGAWDASG